MHTPEFVLGVDGGNSKTDVAIADLTGNILGRVRGPGNASPIHAPDTVAGNLAQLVRAAQAQVGLAGPLASAALYLANVDLPEEEDALSAALAPYRIAERLTVGNDTLAILRAGTDTGWGVGVVLGAGINAIGVGPDGRTERFLSLGAISGDWGGGMGLAVAAVGTAVRAEDGRGAATELSHALPAHFGLTSAHDLAVAIHKGSVARERLFELSPLVMALARTGDPEAKSLIVRQGIEVAVWAEAVLQRLGRIREATPVILGGGVIRSRDPLLLSTIFERLERLAPRAQVQVLDLPPVAGALAAALDLGGASELAVHAARTHDWDSVGLMGDRDEPLRPTGG